MRQLEEKRCFNVIGKFPNITFNLLGYFGHSSPVWIRCLFLFRLSPVSAAVPPQPVAAPQQNGIPPSTRSFPEETRGQVFSATVSLPPISRTIVQNIQPPPLCRPSSYVAAVVTQPAVRRPSPPSTAYSDGPSPQEPKSGKVYRTAPLNRGIDFRTTNVPDQKYVNHLIDWLIDWFVDLSSNHWLWGWMIDWLIDWFTGDQNSIWPSRFSCSLTSVYFWENVFTFIVLQQALHSACLSQDYGRWPGALFLAVWHRESRPHLRCALEKLQHPRQGKSRHCGIRRS